MLLHNSKRIIIFADEIGKKKTGLKNTNKLTMLFLLGFRLNTCHRSKQIPASEP